MQLTTLNALAMLHFFKVFSLSLCVFVSLCLKSDLDALQPFTHEKVQEAYTKAEYKAAIAALLELLQTAPKEQHASLQQQLARIYYKDQDREKAFQSFLKALESANIEPLPPITEEENTLYAQALTIYLEHHGAEAPEGARKILHLYEGVIAAHPNYYLLGYLLSAAYANLDRFEEFFYQFYQSYCFFPQHYMAYKIKTILHSQLFMRAQTPAGQDLQRRAILDNANMAIQKNPHDATLYKMVINFALENQKEQSLVTCLNKIIDENMMIPRADIAFYVQQAVLYKQKELAQRFLNVEHQWFPKSRTLDAAQRYLDNQ